MTRSGIEQYLYVMDRAFNADTSFGAWHSFLVNLESVTDADWLAVPPSGVRSAFQLVQHVGESKYVYASQAFGDGSISWGRPETLATIEETTPRTEVVRWLQEGHDQLRRQVAALVDDSELTALRPDIWGTQKETRWLIDTIVQHDLYHAGELNHIRALSQQNDEWGNEP